MRRTEKLGLPIFDNPNEDKFGLDEWNYANQTIDEAYDEIDKIRKGIISINASAEVIEARMGKENLGDKMKEVSFQLEQIDNKVITPEMFGAVGDGIADDTKAIQYALDYLQFGGVLELTRGKVYKVTHTLLLNNDTKIIGYGSKIFFEANHVDSVLFAHKLFNSNTEWGKNCSFEGFEFETSVEKGNGITLCRMNGCVIKNISCNYVYWHILDLTHCKNVIVENVNGTSNFASIQFDTLSDAGGVTITREDGIPIYPDVKTEATSGINVSNCNVKSTTHAGFHFHRTNGNDITIRNCKVSNSKYAIYGDVNCNWNNIKILNNVFQNCESLIQMEGYYNDILVDGNELIGKEDETTLSGFRFSQLSSRESIQAGYTKNIKITNNTIKNVKSNPLDMFDGVIVNSNIFINCGFDGYVTPGQFTDFYAIGLAQCKNVEISKNLFRDCRLGCIRFYTTSPPTTSGIRNVKITENISENCHNFITSIESGNSESEFIDVSNNTIRTSTTANHIINIVRWKNSTVKNNYIEQSGLYSIFITNSANVVVENNIIQIKLEISNARGIQFTNSTGSTKRNIVNGFTEQYNYHFNIINNSVVDVDEQYGGYIDETSGGFWIFVHNTKPGTTRLQLGSRCVTKDLASGYLGYIYTSNGWKGYGQIQS